MHGIQSAREGLYCCLNSLPKRYAIKRRVSASASGGGMSQRPYASNKVIICRDEPLSTKASSVNQESMRQFQTHRFIDFSHVVARSIRMSLHHHFQELHIKEWPLRCL